MTELTDFTQTIKPFKNSDIELVGAKIDDDSFVCFSYNYMYTWSWFLLTKSSRVSDEGRVNLYDAKRVDPTGFIYNDEIYRIKFDGPSCMNQTVDYYLEVSKKK